MRTIQKPLSPGHLFSMLHYTGEMTLWEREWVSSLSETLEWDKNRDAHLAYEDGLGEKRTKPIKKKWWEDTQFDPTKTYPRGILQEIPLSVNGWDYSVKFFPSCYDVGFAIRHRYCEGPGHGEIEMCNREEARDSWNLDEISSEQTRHRRGCGGAGKELSRNYWMDEDIKKIEEMTKDDFDMWMRDYEHFELWYATKMFLEFNHAHPGFEKEEDEWVNIHTFTEEEEKFFEREIQSMNLHHLRASAGPPTGEYYMNVSYDLETGLPDKNKRTGCWRYEDWCPETGRQSLMVSPENNGSFSTFNKEFVPFGIQWPKDIQEKSEGECGEKRFSGLQSCGSWMEWTMDNEGRFVANGMIEKNGLLVTDYGGCFLQGFHIQKNNLKVGDKVKILCRDNDVLYDWATPLKCSKVIMVGPAAHEEFADCGWY